MAEPVRLPPGEKGTDLRTEADDGFYWVRLVTRGALDREGACMGHCVGDGDYEEYCGAEDLSDSAIWSLRRPDGISVLTVQIVADQVDTVKGYRNHPPGRGAALQFRHLVAAWKAAGKSLVAWTGSGIVIAPDGRTFRRDRVPPDVQAAIDEAEHAARQARGEPGRDSVFLGVDIGASRHIRHIIAARLLNGLMRITASDETVHEMAVTVHGQAHERIDLRVDEDDPPLNP